MDRRNFVGLSAIGTAGLMVSGQAAEVNTDKVSKIFHNVEELVASDTLADGEVVRTLGYYDVEDGGGTTYIIVGSDTGTADNGSIIDINNGQQQAQAIFSAGAISVAQFGAVGDGDTDNRTNDKDAIEAAWAFRHSIYFLPKKYYAPGLVLDGKSLYSSKTILGNSATIIGDNISIQRMFKLKMDSITFEAFDELFFEGLRYCQWNNVDFVGLIKWGKYNQDVGDSWSTYWCEFNQCRFAGIEFMLSVTDANFNSNSFNTCEFRSGDQESIFEFRENEKENGAFSSNTFIGCDLSYAPVFNIIDDYNFFSVTFIGGYLDTGSDWYHENSNKIKSLEVIGLRNPSGKNLDNSVSANLRLTTGGARTKTTIPSGAVSLLKTEEIPERQAGNRALTISSVPLPFSGDYSISAIFKQHGENFQATKFENLNAGATSDVYGILDNDGYSSFTFFGNRGDVINVVLDGDIGTDTEILYLALTPGAGVPSAVPYRVAHPYDTTNSNPVKGNTVELAKIELGTYAHGFYRVEIFTRNMNASGGGEKIILDLGVSSGGSVIEYSISELSRCSVNGPGGASNSSGKLEISAITEGTSLMLLGTLSGHPESVNCNTRVYLQESA